MTAALCSVNTVEAVRCNVDICSKNYKVMATKKDTADILNAFAGDCGASGDWQEQVAAGRPYV